ncbi:MAG: hypothetical protein ACXVNO_00055 [Bacteroidia bacterium]
MALLFSSCAAIFNTKKTSIRILPAKNIKVITVENNIKSDQNNYIVLRSPENLKVKIQVDSVFRTIDIPARKSLVYWENILNFGIGFVPDNKTQKRFSYPRRVFLEKKDTAVKIVFYPTVKKGTIELCILLPYANSYFVKTSNGYYPANGFLGIGLGANFYYKDNKYVSVNAGACMDNAVPFPVGVDYFGDYQRVNVSFINIRNQILFNRFDFGYGLSYATSNWVAHKTLNSSQITLTKQNVGLGFSFSLKYHFLKFLSLGAIYQPALININYKPTFGYQDFITIEAAANFRIRQRKHN